ncbi:MAG: ACT domain-containing protein [Candidatus Heimdallarchaeota archaeon]|nr:ACT domain-containing protein [Candidatus Heimdallarchaeota archaeon]
MNIEQVLREGKFYVKEKTYSIVKANKKIENCFAMIQDADDSVTLIVEQWTDQHKLKGKDVIDLDRDWRIITFDMELPFDLIGFIAHISGALAKEDISIFVLSAFTTDHILVKEKNLQKTISVLTKLGLSET